MDCWSAPGMMAVLITTNKVKRNFIVNTVRLKISLLQAASSESGLNEVSEDIQLVGNILQYPLKICQ